MQRRFFRRSSLSGACLVALLLLCAVPSSRAQRLEDVVYKNPLTLQTLNRAAVENCADPSVVRGQAANDRRWYLFCSSGPLGEGDRDVDGRLIIHTLPAFTSFDLVNWMAIGDALATRPAWARADATLSAPEIHFFNGKYFLYYTVADTTLPDGGSAIGVATSSAPTGPWSDSGAPVVEPQPAPQSATARRWLSDASVLLDDDGQKYIYFGGAAGGIAARRLAADGLKTEPLSQTQITIGQRYEGASVLKRAGFYYLFASVPDCCRGPLTGANVFAGRATNPLGPFTDRDGNALTSGRVGGTPVVSANGNRWIGTGHSAVVSDMQGHDWLIYHAIDRNAPYFARETGLTKRPVLLDQLDWSDGWPTVRAGRWASDTPLPAPATQSGDVAPDPSVPQRPERLDVLLLGSDEFNAPTLGRQWAWVRPPLSSSYGIVSGTLRLDSQAGTLLQESNTAPVLTTAAPSDNYVAETRVRLNLPPEGCCYNAVQAGLIIYADDDNYLKLTHSTQLETRQIEFAKEVAPVLPNYPRYGAMTVGTPGEWTYLRIMRRTVENEEQYTAFTSRDGVTWTRGGVWTHALGMSARIGLVSMGGAGFVANFDYLRVYQLKDSAPTPTPTATPLPFP